MPSLRRSLILSLAQQYTGLAITVPSIMILARFLGPKETGVFSVALAFTNLVHVIRDFGVGAWIVQEHELTRDKLRSAFTVSLLMAWLIALALFLAGPVLGEFFHETGVTSVVYVLALSFLIIPFGAPARAVLRRELAYGALYVIVTTAAVVRSGVSIGLAAAGMSYMSLAWGSLAGVVATSATIMAFRWRDVWMLPGFKEWRGVLSFGWKKISSDILAQVANNANDFVVGRMLGLGAAGLFSRGAGLINMFKAKFQGAIGSVMYPAFASRDREGKRADELYAKSMSYMTAIAWPFYIFAAIMATPIILAAFGPRWVAAIPILRILAVAAALGSLKLYTAQLLTATGHINSVLKVRTITQPVRIGLIIGAAFYSLEAVAAVQIVAGALGLTVMYRELGKHLGIRFLSTLKATGASATITVTSNIVPMVIFALYVTGRLTNPWAAVFVAGAGWCIGWLAGALFIRHPILEEVESALARFRAGRYLLRVMT